MTFARSSPLLPVRVQDGTPTSRGRLSGHSASSGPSNPPSVEQPYPFARPAPSRRATVSVCVVEVFVNPPDGTLEADEPIVTLWHALTEQLRNSAAGNLQLGGEFALGKDFRRFSLRIGAV